MRPLPLLVAAVACSAMLAADAAASLADRRKLGNQGMPGRTVVLVLGFGNRSPRINLVNRWRARSGIRTANRYDADLVVFSGGDVRGQIEADLLAAYARRRGLARRVAVERRSRSTFENLSLSAPLLNGATRIAIVSNPFHAHRARSILWATRPDLATRLVAPAYDRRGLWTVGFSLAVLYEVIRTAVHR
ncbi:YdcF family protein [Microbacterium sp.]|uniref:YdcF family protein n=1 Tax=Microbacterium sp. TaxID=51671 RepID=UPI003C708DCA